MNVKVLERGCCRWQLVVVVVVVHGVGVVLEGKEKMIFTAESSRFCTAIVGTYAWRLGEFLTVVTCRAGAWWAMLVRTLEELGPESFQWRVILRTGLGRVRNGEPASRSVRALERSSYL